MAQEVYAAILRLVNPEVNKGFSVSYTLPNSNKPTTLVWNKENNFEAQIPTKITYVDDHKRTQVFRENYALDLLNGYGQKAKKPSLRLLEFVKEVKKEVYDVSVFTGLPEPKEEDKPLTELPKESSVTDVQKENKKENKNEKK